MALQNSGALSLNEMHVEAGGSSGSQCTINDSDIRGLIDKSSGATMSFNEWYGASNVSYVITVSPNISGSGTYDLSSALSLGTHGQWTISPQSNDITVDIAMWGGGGASGWLYYGVSSYTTNVGPGGGGGSTLGRLVLKHGTNYVLQVGEGGDRIPGSTGSQTAATYVAGGIPGYGWGAEGGGYSGIFKTSVSQANAMLMAGGGGGGGDSLYDGSGAGAGGGTSGAAAGGGAQSGGGGTQSAGGAASAYNAASAGYGLTGGYGQQTYANTYFSGGGGGGGYYGGGGGNVGGGGGGSGYVKSGDSDLTAYGSNSGTAATTAGSGSTPGNNGHALQSGAGTGQTSTSYPGSGTDGRIVLTLVT